MEAIHITARQAKRLRPITDDGPKPLIELAGSSLLERNIRFGRRGSTTNIVVTVYEAECIEELGYDIWNRSSNTI